MGRSAGKSVLTAPQEVCVSRYRDCVLFALVVFAALSAGTARVHAVDFRRGDSNSDGILSMADAQHVLSFVSRQGSAPECLSAADANDDAKIDIADGIWILNFLFRGGPPSDPYPDPGSDPTPDTLCEAYGSGAELTDPQARLRILDATAQGGNEGSVKLRISVSSSASLAGYSGSVRLPPVISPYSDPRGNMDLKDLSGTHDGGFRSARIRDSVLEFGFMSSLTGTASIPPGEDVTVLEVTACLVSGTRPGEHPLTLVEGELVDSASGRRIVPALQGGTLNVLTSVPENVGCDGPVDPATCARPAPDPFPQIDASFRLDDGSGVRGGEVVVPFTIRATEVVQGYSYSVDFDEGILQASQTEEVAIVGSRGFKVHEYNNADQNPGSAGVDEGFFVGAAVFNIGDVCGNLPANRDNEVLRFHLSIRPDAPLGESDLEFLNGGVASGGPVPNNITALGQTVSPETESAFVLVNARVNVLPDLTAFIRGDSNGDEKVDISDAANTLGFLFLGDSGVACFDAADANDDGAIDIADAVTTLNHLFEGGKDLPPPYPAVGEDPTSDTLGCLTRH